MLKALVLHTLPPADAGIERSRDEFDLDEGAAHVASAIDGAVVAAVRGEAVEILGLLDAHRPDVIFNLCEAPLARPDLEPHAAALFEWLGVPFTGSGSETLALCRHKPRINAVLAAQGIAVPREGVFPAIVKPADQDGSAGIHVDSVCADAEAVERARARWPGAVVVQEFLPGREFVVSLWGRRGPEHVSIGETVFRAGLKLNTYASKWDVDSAEYANSPLDYRSPIDPSLREQLVAAARGAWHAAGARGYLRVDLRCNAQGRPCVLDVNPNPAIGAGIGICRAVEEAGWDWSDFVRLQLESARDR
jgi:D-alanine-D-alanine ligase